MLNSLAAIQAVDPLSREELTSHGNAGGAVIVGSYVPKTSRQINILVEKSDIHPLEVNVQSLLSDGRETKLNEIIEKSLMLIRSGEDVILYTSRELVMAETAEKTLRIGSDISTALVDISRALINEASFIVAKGGITSHDIAAKGLDMQKATVLGQAIPGVPVIEPDERPGFKYIIFPGNVGEDDALLELFNKIKRHHS
jgi:uncharacterized protein YgbK (DUF1537 family)